MFKHCALIASVFLGSCVAAAHIEQSQDGICNINYTEVVKFSRLPVLVYADRHGDYVRIESCPNNALAIDFSNSGLYEKKFEKLLNQMRVNANRGGAPIRMVVSGSYTGSRGDDSRATVVVTRIIKYDLTAS